MDRQGLAGRHEGPQQGDPEHLLDRVLRLSGGLAAARDIAYAGDGFSRPPTRSFDAHRCALERSFPGLHFYHCRRSPSPPGLRRPGPRPFLQLVRRPLVPGPAAAVPLLPALDVLPYPVVACEVLGAGPHDAWRMKGTDRPGALHARPAYHRARYHQTERRQQERQPPQVAGAQCQADGGGSDGQAERYGGYADDGRRSVAPGRSWNGHRVQCRSLPELLSGA